MAGGSFGGGDGSVGDPYLVEDAADLDAVRNDLTANYEQTADIDLGSWGNWTPIGDWGGWFTGDYDGSGFKIENAVINHPASGEVGLFGVNEGRIAHIVIDNVSVVGDQYVGALVGYNYLGVIEAIVADGSVQGSYYVGGIVGFGYGGSIEQSANMCNVSGEGTLGGMVGEANEGVVVSECYNTADIVSSAFGILGGVAGSFKDSTATNCYSIGNISGGDYDMGGLLGIGWDSTVINCYSVGSVPYVEESGILWTGGLIGGRPINLPTVTNSYYNSEVAGHDDTNKGTPKTTNEMKEQATFVSWDFATIWNLNSAVNDGYPFLRALAPLTELLTPPELQTEYFRSAKPTVYFWFPKVTSVSEGPGLHFRVQVYADEAMTVLLDEVSSEDADFTGSRSAWQYERLASLGDRVRQWRRPSMVSGVPSSDYLNYNLYLRTQIEIGPRRKVYIRGSVGY